MGKSPLGHPRGRLDLHTRIQKEIENYVNVPRENPHFKKMIQHNFFFVYRTNIRLMKFPVCRQGLTRRSSEPPRCAAIPVHSQNALSTSAQETSSNQFANGSEYAAQLRRERLHQKERMPRIHQGT